MSDMEYIPVNPPINSKALHERMVISTATRVEPRVVVVIPPPPVATRVEVSKPAARRRFEQPPQVMRDEMFRSRR